MAEHGEKNGPGGGESLVVRQHERVSCALAAEIGVSADHAEKVVLSRSVADANGRVNATATDVSRGGMGLRSGTFFPKHGLLTVKVKECPGRGAGEWEATVRVERVCMVDRGPTYYLGTSFAGGPADAARAEGLIGALKASEQAGGGPPSA